MRYRSHIQQDIMTPRSSRKKTHSKSTDIRSIINDGFDDDEILSNCSNALFSLDDESKIVLEILAKNGPLSEYKIGKIDNNYNISRDSIRRRIEGTKSFPSLRDQDFIQIISTEKHRTGKVIKKYGLTFKGLLSTLNSVKFEDNYLSKKYFSEIEKLVESDQNFIDLSFFYVKSHLVLILLWSKLNNLNFLLNSHISNFFLEERTNYYLKIGLLDNIDDDELETYTQAGIRYFVLKHAMFSMVKKLSADSVSHLYSDKKTKHIFKNFKREKRNPKEFFVKYCIKDWVLNLELANSYSGNKNKLVWAEYIFDEPGKRSTFLEWDNQIRVDKMYSKIAKKCGLRKTSVKILTSSKV